MDTGADPGEITWTQDADGALLRFSGPIDREAVGRFRRLVPPASWPARASLASVTSLDAAGLQLLVHLARKPRRRGDRLELLDVPEPIRPVLAHAGLADLLPRADGTART